MDYHLPYFRLIERAKTRQTPEEYTERHHVIPKCVGGTDDASNIVVLTAREHIHAHLLLVKMYPRSRKLKMALSAMLMNPNGERTTVRRHALLRELSRQARVGFVYSDESKKRMSESAKARGMNPDTIAKAIESNTGKQLSSEHRSKISQSMTGRKRGPYKKRTKYKVDPGISRNGE